VDRAVADEFVPRLVDAVRNLVTGSPHDPDVEVGPLVDEPAARRVEEWITEATDRGAKILTGGDRTGPTIEPTVLVDVPHDVRAWTEELFGPVLVVSVVDGVDEAFEQVNNSAYGLQAGVFTHDLPTAFRAMSELEVGGVIIGDVPSYRADQMPYGGTKSSGIGREGVRAAMDDFTEQRTMVLTELPL
jgi:acyl-CoA reductase-like NAD-dependent aldehyde dehydrogenase